METTNRGVVGEFLYGRWCLFKALCYSAVTMKQITTTWEGWNGEGRLLRVETIDKVFYEYGAENDT